MIAFLAGLFARREPALSDASARDAAAIARLHGASFRRGWSDGSTAGLVFARSAGAPAIISKAATSRRPRWCFAAIWRDAPRSFPDALKARTRNGKEERPQ